jgi:hypothetical protein
MSHRRYYYDDFNTSIEIGMNTIHVYNSQKSFVFLCTQNHDKRGIIRKHPLPSITAANSTVSNNPLFERKLELATEGLEPSFVNKLKTAVSNDNALIIANYIIAMKTEINPSDKYRIITSKHLQNYHNFSKIKYHLNK